MVRQFKFARASRVIPLAVLCVYLARLTLSRKEEEEQEQRKKGGFWRIGNRGLLSLFAAKNPPHKFRGRTDGTKKMCACARLCVYE